MKAKTQTIQRRRCAIYTRKSSEEGLEQSFNSLDAQREACAAYITSQAGEGWRLFPERYDDGGFSGGNLDRPAVQRLLKDVDRGAIDVVVVYKVDRLTRLLTDFARIVERFEAKGVSFVSVTQSFNTTSSMGRLTLNVLLSFAQFEREVTGERIRDKIAASKAKGLWMGGLPPLGYDPDGRTLKVNPAEAETVRLIFQRYLDAGSVQALAPDLKEKGIHSKSWTTAKERRIEGGPFSRGALYHLLRNRLYRGEIVHKGNVHAGQHTAIIDTELFEAVRASLDAKVKARRNRPTIPGGSPLTGLLYDSAGQRMSPAHARGKSGKAYRYYVSTAALTGRPSEAGAIPRVPAQAIEDLVWGRLIAIVDETVSHDWAAMREQIDRVAVRKDELAIRLARPPGGADPATLAERLPPGDRVEQDDELLTITVPVRLKFRGGAVRLIDSFGRSAIGRRPPDPALTKAIARAHAWRARLTRGDVQSVADLAKAERVTDSYIRRRLRLAFLAPDVTHAILDGRQPPGLTLEQILNSGFPLHWHAQRRLFGFDRTG